MKKWFNVVKSALMKPSYKVDKSIFIFIAIVAFVVSDNINSIYGVWVGIILALSFLIYIIKLLIEHSNQGQIMVFVIGEMIAIFIIMLNYLHIKRKDNDLIMPVIPILIMALMISGYKHILKSGDKERIEKVRVKVLIGIPILIIIFLIMGYAALYL